MIAIDKKKNEKGCSLAPHKFGLAPAVAAIRGSHANRIFATNFLCWFLCVLVLKNENHKMAWQRANADNRWRCRWSQELLTPILLPTCEWFNQCSKLCHFCCRLCSWMSDDSCKPPETSFTMASQVFLRILFEEWFTTLWISVFTCHAVRASDVSHWQHSIISRLFGVCELHNNSFPDPSATTLQYFGSILASASALCCEMSNFEEGHAKTNGKTLFCHTAPFVMQFGPKLPKTPLAPLFTSINGFSGGSQEEEEEEEEEEEKKKKKRRRGRTSESDQGEGEEQENTDNEA